MEIAQMTIKELFSMFREMKIARGTAYLMAKGHRYSGILLSLYLVAHVYTLSGLADPDKFQREMNILSHPLFMFLEWCLVIPLAFHAFNGGRLVLFELFQQHDDTRLVRWSLGLGFGFSLLMGLFMILGSESVSPLVFWLLAVVLMVLVVLVVFQQVWKTFNKTLWKLQRITGSALLLLALGHYLFMHLNVTAGHNAGIILERMQSPFILGLDFLFLTVVMFHAWYGLLTMITDKVAALSVRRVLFGLLTLISLVLYLAGIRILTLTTSL